MLRRRLLLGADIAVIVATIGVLSLLGLLGGDQGLWLLLFTPGWLVAAKLANLYDRDHRSMRHLTTDELPSLMTWATAGVGVSALLLSVFAHEAMSSTAAVVMWVAIVVLVPTARGLARWYWRRITPPERAILIGSGPVEAATRRKLELFPDIHLEIVDTIPIDAHGEGVEQVASELRRLMENRPIEGVVLASQSVSEELIATLVAHCRRARIKLRMTPPARAMFGTAAQLGHVADLPILAYTTWDVSRTTLLIKRAIDLVLGAIALALLAPVMIVVALAIKLGDGGEVFFRQTRTGRNGLQFRIVKFRTMVADAEARLPALVSLDELGGPAFKLVGDPRVTGVGRVLRRWSLDELPQLINVVRGEMSLVGPRPEEVALTSRYSTEQQIRLSLKPGLTGPMQIYGRGALGFEERLAVEREYIENFSLSRDLRMMLMTIPAIISGRGAY